nr:tyrosine decarboxylase 1 [Ipomoea batatas]
MDGVFPIQELESCRLFVAPEKESWEGKLGGRFVHDVREVGAHGGAGGEKRDSGNIERQGKLYKPWLHGIMEDQIRVQDFQDFGEIRCRHIQDFLEGVVEVAREAISGLVDGSGTEVNQETSIHKIHGQSKKRCNVAGRSVAAMRKNRRQAVVTVTTFSSDYTIQELYYGTAGGMVPRGRLLTVANTVGEQIRAMQSMNAPFPYSAVRDKILRVVGKELIGKLVVYASDQTHSTLQKAFQENKGAKFSKYELISSAIAGLTLQSLYLRWFKLRKAPVLPSNNLNYAENFLFMLDSLFQGYKIHSIELVQANAMSMGATSDCVVFPEHANTASMGATSECVGRCLHYIKFVS